MTIIEAVKSGKAFRRKAYGWTVTWMIPAGDHWTITPEDILADDWEVME